MGEICVRAKALKIFESYTEKYFVVQRFILIVCNNYVQCLTNTVLLINGEMNTHAFLYFVVPITKYFVRYSFMPCKYKFTIAKVPLNRLQNKKNANYIYFLPKTEEMKTSAIVYLGIIIQ